MKKTCPFNLAAARPRILWEITSKCNLKCRHCLYYDEASEAVADLSYEQICRIIDKIAEDGRIKEIWISGGEPLVRKDIYQIINYVSEKNLIPSISTNGTLVTRENAKILYDGGIRYAHVSIDGGDSRTHDELRGVAGAFEKTVNGVEALTAAGIMTGVSFMVTRDSVGQVKEMMEFAKDLRMSVVSFYMVEPLGRAVGKDFGEKELLTKELEKLKAEIEAEYGEYAGRIEFPRLLTPEMEILEECHAEKFLTITADGKLGVCPWLMKSQGKFEGGNLLENRFSVAWDDCTGYIKNMKNARKHQAVCQTCQFSSECGQGCPAVSVYSEKSPKGFDLACRSYYEK